MAKNNIPLWERYSLSIQEASLLFGVGEKRIRQLVAEHQGEAFILEVGAHVRIKRELFEQFLNNSSVL